jgi:peptide/nickel transport system permease protein
MVTQTQQVDAPSVSVIAIPLRHRPRRDRARHLWQNNPALILGVSLVSCVIILAIVGPFIAPYDPTEPDYAAAVQAPSLAHPFGTDKFGRDQFSRVLHGARVDLAIGVIATVVPLLIGVVVGSLAGYYGGAIDAVFMRIIDIQVAFPFYVLLIAILAILGPGLINMYYALILVSWVAFARLIRGEILVAKMIEYAVAAKTIGCSDLRIIVRHLLPNVIGPTLIFATSAVVLAILSGAALGFLGLGVQAPKPEWGVMIAESREFMVTAWWLPFFPGLAIAIVGISFSLLGDGLTQYLRRRSR